MQAWWVWILTVCLILGSGASAQAPGKAVVQQLREQGYVGFEVSRTLLGRVRVVALTPNGGRREIVYSPASGEILRDYYEAADGTTSTSILDRSDDEPGVSDDEEQSRGSQSDKPNGATGEDSRPWSRQDGDGRVPRTIDRLGRSGADRGAGQTGGSAAAGAEDEARGTRTSGRGPASGS